MMLSPCSVFWGGAAFTPSLLLSGAAGPHPSFGGAALPSLLWVVLLSPPPTGWCCLPWFFEVVLPFFLFKLDVKFRKITCLNWVN